MSRGSRRKRAWRKGRPAFDEEWDAKYRSVRRKEIARDGTVIIDLARTGEGKAVMYKMQKLGASQAPTSKTQRWDGMNEEAKARGLRLEREKR